MKARRTITRPIVFAIGLAVLLGGFGLAWVSLRLGAKPVSRNAFDHNVEQGATALTRAILGFFSFFVVMIGAILLRVSAPVPGEKQREVPRWVVPWVLTFVLGGALAASLRAILRAVRGGEPIVWRHPYAACLAIGAGFVAVLAFHLQRRRAASMAFSQTAMVPRIGVGGYLADLPAVLRVLAVAALGVALARPETYRTVKHEEDTIDIMIVVDMSKSMEDRDLQLNRLDAAQRVIRRFLHRTTHDRIGLVVFGQQAMLQCPLTQDTRLVEQIVKDLRIGDVPELGTAIGDGLALALAQLRRSDAKSKVVILLSDGDSNWVTDFEPDEAARAAAAMKVKVYTLLVGREESDLFGGMSVNPETLRSIARLTGGDFYRATDYETFDHGFQTVRNKLDTTKRVRVERLPDKQLFVPFVLFAIGLIMVELVLSHTRLRRLP